MVEYVGQRLGNYRLTRFLGRGSYADVYLGEHHYLNTLAAIKILRVQLVDHALHDFLREARTIARLEHPSIVRVLEFGVEDAIPFLVMSYAPHGTLGQRHPEGSLLPAATIVSYVKQLASALQYAHDSKIIHRDVKPDNMLVGHNQHIMLSDFGLAVTAHNSQSASGHESPGPAGTIAYIAPEQFEGKPCLASDQYALGVVVYEWFCGTRPFTGSDWAVATQHLQAPPRPMRDVVPTIVPAIEHVVMRALAKDPQMRFACVQDFAVALEEAYAVAASSADGEAAVPRDGGAATPNAEGSEAPHEMVPMLSEGEPLLAADGDLRQPFLDLSLRVHPACSTSPLPSVPTRPMPQEASLRSRYRLSRRAALVVGLGGLAGLMAGALAERSQSPFSDPRETSALSKLANHMSASRHGAGLSSPTSRPSQVPSPTSNSTPTSAFTTCSGQIGINDAAGVLDAAQICRDATAFPYSITIYTRNTIIKRNNGDINQQVRALVTNSHLVVLAINIDTTHHREQVALSGGGSVPLAASAYDDALAAFHHTFNKSGDYTGATVAVLSSLQSSSGS